MKRHLVWDLTKPLRDTISGFVAVQTPVERGHFKFSRYIRRRYIKRKRSSATSLACLDVVEYQVVCVCVWYNDIICTTCNSCAHLIPVIEWLSRDSYTNRDSLILWCDKWFRASYSVGCNYSYHNFIQTLQWRHNGSDGVSNHQPHDCSLNCLFSRRSKKTLKLCVTGLRVGNAPVTGEFFAHRTSNAENASIWWRHHVLHALVLCEYKFTL